ncbi:EEA1 (predicted) [Pycnogonum litorale]
MKCDGEEGLSYVKGGFIKVESGRHRNLYGKIEGIDEDNSRIMVRLTLSDEVVSLSRFVVCLVTKKEYKREAKILKMEAKLESLLERCLASETECEKLRSTTAELRKKYDDSLTAMQDLERENQTLQMETQKHLTRKWLEDSEVDSCTNCPKIFSVTVRKHHCRNCGKIFCHECSSKQATVASSKKPVRVCDTCFKEVLNH